MKRFRKVLSIILSISFIFVSLNQIANAQTGKLIGISDGDIVTVLDKKIPVKVCLYKIDCPEGGQDTSKMVSGKTVTMKAYDNDTYVRTVAEILSNGKTLNEEPIKGDYVWIYPKYHKTSVYQHCTLYEVEVINNKIDLSNHTDPMPLWDFKQDKSILNTNFKEMASGIYYRGNTQSFIFHKSNCRHFNCKNCTKIFQSREEAISAGYRPCKICKP
jgi:micrococcal nuclease